MSQRHSQALDRFLEQYAFRHPVPATRAGIRLHDHELPGWSREAREDELDEFEALTVAIDEEHDEAPDDATLASDRLALEAQLARACMDVRQLAFESGFFEDRNPTLWFDEIIDGIRSVVARERGDGDRDDTMDSVASIAMRLHEVPRFLDDLAPTLAEGTPAPWRSAALRAAQALRQELPAMVDGWLLQRAVDTESATWVREALTTALAAIDGATTTIDGLPVLADDSVGIGPEAYATLLSRGCFMTTEPAVLRERAQQELDALQGMLTGAPIDAIYEEPGVTTTALPSFAAQTANRVGRLGVLARPSLVDALPGAWLADAWQGYLQGFSDGDEEPLHGTIDQLPESAIAHRMALAARALADVQIHTHELGPDDVSAFLESTLDMTASEAESVVWSISMTPGRALHAWFGAHALHQTRLVLEGRGGTDAATFAVRAMTYGAIPAPLLSRLLLAN